MFASRAGEHLLQETMLHAQEVQAQGCEQFFPTPEGAHEGGFASTGLVNINQPKALRAKDRAKGAAQVSRGTLFWLQAGHMGYLSRGNASGKQGLCENPSRCPWGGLPGNSIRDRTDVME